MSARPRQDPLLPLGTLATLLLGMGLVAVPHLLRMPLWITGLVVFCGAWRLFAALRGEALPRAWLRALLTVATAAGIFASFGTLLGRDAGTALLLAMTALKLLEMRRKRDTYIVLYLGYLLIGTQFLFDQSLAMAGYLLLAVWIMTVLLLCAQRAPARPEPWRYAGRAGVMLLQAIPFMLVLFLLFPRLSGPLWRLPADAYGGVTGLSETMEPGSISQLSRSDEVAFRVDFAGEAPPPEQRYWRGPVLEAYDGRVWARWERPSRLPPAAALLHEPAVAYSVILQPHHQHWLFALDLPAAAPAGSFLTTAAELRSHRPIHDPYRYELRSHPNFQLDRALSPAHLSQNLSLPPDAHPRARALAAQWRRQTGSDRELLERAVAYFRSQPFVYTLTPPALLSDPVDEFLFETRRGFCEHYASAFAVLMRAAGVPARVVTGYQGGQINPLGGYMIVRQADAHAWTEVWLQDRGWVRIDATALVSPARVEQGVGSAIPAGEPLPLMARPEANWLKRLRLGLDAVNTGWNRWVLGYGPALQQRLLGSVGLSDWQRIAAALAAGIGALLALLAAIMLIGQRRPGTPPPAALYQRFCRKLARRGLARRPGEGPVDFAARVRAERPDLAAQVDDITRLYVALRYEQQSSTDGIQQLRRLVGRFKP